MSNIRVLMLPHLSQLGDQVGGIPQVVRSYFAHLPEFGIELVESDATSYDVKAVHAGLTGGDCDCAHIHGLYFSADYAADEWEWRVNARVIDACRNAKVITVPSEYVAETFRRDMRLNPHIVPHGIDWAEWQHKEDNEGFVLWNKTRRYDVCDNSILDVLMNRFPNVPFVSTLPTPLLEKLSPQVWPPNFKIFESGGKTPHAEMKQSIQRAGIYLSAARETFGIGTLEAMAAGVPVLGWDWGGNSFLVQHGVSGYLAQPGDVDDLCEGLVYCLKHRRVLGANGRELAKAWTWEKACEMVAGVYRLATAEQPAAVSVVIPVYNKPESQLIRAIQSCQEQTLQPKWIFVVNDGSSNTEEIKDCVAKFDYDHRVRYIEQSNSGVAAARNNGISHADTKYICCLDADDWLEPIFLEVCVRELESNRSLGIAYTSLRAHNADGSNGISQWPGQFDADRQLTYARKMNQVPTACVFRRDAWERVGGYKSRYCPDGAGSEDAAFWSAICSIGYNARLMTCDNSGEIYRLESEIPEIKERISYLSPSSASSPLNTTVSPEFDEYYKEFENLQGILRDKLSKLEQLYSTDKKPHVLFNYSADGGFVHGNREYSEIDWLSMYPWAKDGLHPFASVATPKRWSHPVRQYDDPAISVIIPVGPGHEKEVENALDSLEMQSFRKWEAIVVWDTGDDDSTNILKTAYPYVRWAITNRQSAGTARNFGVSIARAPLLFYLDADDVLADDDALDKLLKAWNEQEAIIYSDYLGKAVWDYEEAVKEFGDRLLAYHQKSGQAVFSSRAVDYDPALAQRQPEYNPNNPNMPYYHWCLVSVLIPKAWHKTIGGFDEAMETWEDVDYHWRLARAGYCFYRVPEPLIMYAYHKGNRREKSAVRDSDSLQKHKSLIQYIKQKDVYQQEPVVCNCGKRKPAAAINGSVQASGMSDNDWVMIEFTFPANMTQDNWGRPLVSPTKQPDPRNPNKIMEYKGYSRRRGDRFLVHVKDQRARPDMFKLVPNEIKAPEEARAELAEPVLLVAEKKRGRAKVAA